MFPRPEIEPTFQDLAPTEPFLTPYDFKMLVAYLRLLDAAEDEANWKEVARIVLRHDPDADPARTRRCWESHLARAEWMTHTGHRLLLASGAEWPRYH
ncbi:DUF2285 domain-containing protein [Gluconacetobacter sacchari]|uniref:DUF2285 domain-containing protein n=1 Tax=Gluconacetobacter sacchari TaxID=92759 RepID=UPI0039B6B2E5